MKVSPLLLLLAAAPLFLAGAVDAKPWWMRGVESNKNDFLPPDDAFRVSSRIDGGLIQVRWVIADGYYLYRQRMDVKAESPDLTIAEPVFPRGKTKTDPYQGTQEIFTQQVEATATYTRSDFGAHPIQVKVTYQGCAEAGLCYPPITKVLFPSNASPAPIAAPQSALPRRGGISAILGGALAFFIAGLLLRKGRRLALPT
jgi:thiol:disulfide interchange protein DsbD